MNFKRLNYTEPAVLRGIVGALISLLAAIGVTVGSDLSGQVETLIVAFSIAWPVLQALWTRAAVFSRKTVDEEVAKARIRPPGPQTPGVADHAR